MVEMRERACKARALVARGDCHKNVTLITVKGSKSRMKREQRRRSRLAAFHRNLPTALPRSSLSSGKI